MQIWLRVLQAVFIVLTLVATVPAVAGERKVLRFTKGATSTTVENSVLRSERDRYIIGARTGQHLAVSIESLENNAVFDVLLPGADDKDEQDIRGVALPGAQEAKTVTVELPVNGNYLIVVGGTRGNATYRLKVAITDTPPVAAKSTVSGTGRGSGRAP